jgi:hypothetical protein
MERKLKKRKPPRTDDIEQNGHIFGSHYANLLLNPEKWCSDSSADVRDTLPLRPAVVEKQRVPKACEALALLHIYSFGRYVLLLVGLLCIVFVCGTLWNKNRDPKDPSSTGWTLGLTIAGVCLTYAALLITQIRAK